MSNRNRLRAKRAKIERVHKLVAERPRASERVDSYILDSGWRKILETRIAPEAGPDFVKAMKRAYYAGADDTLEALVHTDMLEKNGVNRVDALLRECNQFWWDVAEQRQ